MAHPDLDELLNVLLPFAQHMLSEHSEFFPFGASMNHNGEIAHVGGYTGNEHPTSQEIIDLLVGAFRGQATQRELRAAAICLDVRTIPPEQSRKTDAINVHLEHSNGEAVEIFLPYWTNHSGKCEHGELFAAKGEREIFKPLA